MNAWRIPVTVGVFRVQPTLIKANFVIVRGCDRETGTIEFYEYISIKKVDSNDRIRIRSCSPH